MCIWSAPRTRRRLGAIHRTKRSMRDRTGGKMPDADPNVVCALRRRGLNLEPWLKTCEAGWHSSRLDRVFTKNAGNKLSRRRFRACAREVLASARLETHMHPLRAETIAFDFLDIGCAPGGFSCELLHRFPRARGWGITLSPRDGGQNPFRELREHPRFRIWYADIGNGSPLPPKIASRAFVLVVDDLTVTRSALASSDSEIAERLSQKTLALALECLVPGGVLIRRERLDPTVSTMQRLSLLRRRFALWSACKPGSSYALSRAYFLIAVGYEQGPGPLEIDKTARDIAALWQPVVASHSKAIRRELRS